MRWLCSSAAAVVAPSSLTASAYLGPDWQRVVGHQVVTPGASQVVAANPDDPGAEPVRATLTLTTCHPVYSARRRWVVHAVLDTIRAR